MEEWITIMPSKRESSKKGVMIEIKKLQGIKKTYKKNEMV
jgi:hypothetical protein